MCRLVAVGRAFFIGCIVVALQVVLGLRDDILHKDILRIRNHLFFNFNLFTADDTGVEETDIIYYLFTRRHRNVTLDQSLQLIDRKFPIKLLVHGWTEHADVKWCKNMINAYLKRGWYNVISVDWSSKGDTDYVAASRNSKPVGDKIADYLVKLHKKRNVPFKNIHLISHSLGCHVAGFIGQRVFEATGQRLARITALDPAAPIFDVTPTVDMRLSKDDAKFVDIVHTDAGMLGFKFPIGTADFFPNGGSAIQPGCSLLKFDVKYEDFFCSHASSHQLFIKSINYRKFTAKPCDSWDKFSRGLCKDNRSITFGEDVPNNVVGSFYLETNENDIVL